MRGKCLLIFLIIFNLIFAGIAKADWLDDWFEQHTTSSPNYFEAQKRGYLTFGSFSARTGVGERIPLVTIELPRVRGGCGGIDLFLGGFSFVNPDYLVQKLQNLIQAAPVVAFNLALKVLSSSLADEVKWVEDVVNFLNQLQFDECKFLQPLMVKNVEGSTLWEKVQNVAKQVREGYEEFFYSGRKEKIEGESYDETKKQELLQECPAEVQEIWNKGSFLAWVGDEAGAPVELIKAVRAFTGDVVVAGSTGGETPTFKYIEPVVSISDLKKGLGQLNLVLMDVDGSKTVKNVTFLNNITNILQQAYDAKINRTNPPDEYIEYASLSPIPIEYILNVAASAKEPSLYQGVSPVVAYGIYNMLLKYVLSEGQVFISRISSLSDEQECPQIATLREGLRRMSKKIVSYHEIIEDLYMEALNEAQKSLDVSVKMLEYQKETSRIVLQKLGADVASYLLGT